MPTSLLKRADFFVRIFTKRPTAYLYIPRPIIGESWQKSRLLLSLKRANFSSESSLSGRRHVYIFRGQREKPIGGNIPASLLKRADFSSGVLETGADIFLYFKSGEDEMAEKPPSSFTKTCGFFVRIFTKRPTACLYIPRPIRGESGRKSRRFRLLNSFFLLNLMVYNVP